MNSALSETFSLLYSQTCATERCVQGSWWLGSSWEAAAVYNLGTAALIWFAETGETTAEKIAPRAIKNVR